MLITITSFTCLASKFWQQGQVPLEDILIFLVIIHTWTRSTAKADILYQTPEPESQTLLQRFPAPMQLPESGGH